MEHHYSLLLQKYTNFILAFILLLLSFFAYSSMEFELDASSDTLILEQDEDLKKYREIINDYGSNDFLIVTFTDKSKILTQENLEQIALFLREVDTFPWIESSQSIFDVPLLEINGQSITDLTNNVMTINSPGVNINEAEKELLSSPIFKNLIISADGSSTGVLINFKRDLSHEYLINERAKLNEIKDIDRFEMVRKREIEEKYKVSKKSFDAERHRNINEIRDAINKFSSADLELHLGGVSMIADDTISFVKKDIFIFGIGAFVFIIIVLFIIFKDPIWMLACISNCLASLIIMIGIVSLLGWKVTVISSNFIMLMLILSLSMTVHIVVRYRQFILENREKTNIEIIITTIKAMYKPCLFAALTSIFAFATLYTSGIKPVMDFGIMMCVGLTVTYITSFVFLPVMLSFLKLKKIIIDQKLNNSSLFVSIANSYSNYLIIFFIFILSVGIYGTSLLKVENSFVDYFKKDTEIYKGMKLIDDKLGGTTPLDIIIYFENKDDIELDQYDDFLDFGIEYNSADYWFTQEKVNIIKKIHDHLESYPFAGKVLSLASVVRTAEKLNSNKEFDTLELSILYKKLPQDLKKQIIEPYVLIDKNQARISMRIVDTHPDLNRAEFIEDLEDYFNREFSDSSTQITLSGILILYNNMLESLFESQIKSLSLVLSGIFLMLLFLFRSIKLALIAIIPNLIACFAILGTMGILAIPLDLMTITIAAITVGIAVDNCIHYLYRYREYFKKSNNHGETIYKCNGTVGVAIRNTSYTIIAGFSILVFSNFFPTIYFGIFTALAMFIALVGSLTLLPSLLKKYYY